MKPSFCLGLAASLLLGCRGSSQSVSQTAADRATNNVPTVSVPASSSNPTPEASTDRTATTVASSSGNAGPASSPAGLAAAVPTPAVPPAPAAGTNPPPASAGPVINVSVPALPTPVADLVRLAQTRISEEVLVRYVEGVQEPFSLDANQLIYLADLGIPDAVMLALQKKASGSGEVAEAAQPETPATNAAPVAVVQPSPPPATAPAASPASPPYPGSDVGTPAPVYGPAQAGPEASAAAPAPPAGTATAQVAAPATQVTYNVFYDSLAPYGTWVDVGGYGWCWRPTVAVVNVGWRPYCHGGQWLWSDYGWYWHSSYSWGWAPFHYGRWHHAPSYGWVWAPGCDWGPAWVAWRWNGSHCGWAPLPPTAAWSAALGFTWTSGGSAVSVGFGIGTGWWSVSPWSAFCGPRLPNYCLGPSAVGNFVGNTRIQTGSGESINIQGNNNTVVVNKVVDRDFVQPRVRDEIRKVHVGDAPTLAQNTTRLDAAGGATRRPEIAAFRPRVEPVSGNAPAPSPAALARQETRKPVAGSRGADSTLVPGRSGIAGPTLRPEVTRTTPSSSASVPGASGVAAGSVPSARRPLPSSGARSVPPASISPRAEVPQRPAPYPTSPGTIPGRPGSTVTSVPASGISPRPGAPANVAPGRSASPAVPGANVPAPRSSAVPPPRNPSVTPAPARPVPPASSGGSVPVPRTEYRKPVSPADSFPSASRTPSYPGSASPSVGARPSAVDPSFSARPSARPSYPSAGGYLAPSAPPISAPAARPYGPTYSSPAPSYRSSPMPAPAQAPSYRAAPPVSVPSAPAARGSYAPPPSRPSGAQSTPSRRSAD